MQAVISTTAVAIPANLRLENLHLARHGEEVRLQPAHDFCCAVEVTHPPPCCSHSNWAEHNREQGDEAHDFYGSMAALVP